MSDYKAEPFEFYCDIACDNSIDVLAQQCLTSGDFRYMKPSLSARQHRDVLEYAINVTRFKRPDSLTVLNDSYLNNLKYILYNLGEGDYNYDNHEYFANVLNVMFEGFISGCDVVLLKFNDGLTDNIVYKTSVTEYVEQYDLVFDLEFLKNHLLQYNCIVTICKSLDEFNELIMEK